MADFRSDKKFTSTGTVTDGYDTYVDRQDGIDTLVSKDVNDLADSIQEVQKSIIDGYAVTDYLPNAVAFTDGQTIVYDSVSGKMIAGDASGGASDLQSAYEGGNNFGLFPLRYHSTVSLRGSFAVPVPLREAPDVNYTNIALESGATISSTAVGSTPNQYDSLNIVVNTSSPGFSPQDFLYLNHQGFIDFDAEL